MIQQACTSIKTKHNYHSLRDNDHCLNQLSITKLDSYILKLQETTRNRYVYWLWSFKGVSRANYRSTHMSEGWSRKQIQDAETELGNQEGQKSYFFKVSQK